MSAQHTPGPWEIEEDDYGDEIWLGGDGCGMIVVNGWVNGGCMADPVEWAKLQANARLIAAAPDLLSVLEEMLADAETMNEPYRNEAVCERARAAIAKATGQ